jgi:hypothetical protein
MRELAYSIQYMGGIMKKRTLLSGLAVLAFSLQLAVPVFAEEKADVSVVINGVKVHGEATHMDAALGEVWVDAEGYAESLGLQYTYNGGAEFTINQKTLNSVTHNGKPSVNVRAIAEATGGNHILWTGETREVYVLDLPEGAISLEGTTDFMAMGVPGMGQHWGLPTELPTGPIYGVEQGKLVFIEQMVSQEDFKNGKNHVDIPGMKGLPSPAVVHSDIEFLPAGHPGFEVPHFDIHHYFVTHEEHLKFSMPPGGAAPGHQAH